MSNVLQRYYGRVGSDPEAFVLVNSTVGLKRIGLSPTLSGSAIPAFYALGARPVMSKDPADRKIELPHGDVMEDGMAVEWTVTPTPDMNDLVEMMRQNIASVQEIVHDTCRGVLSVAPEVDVLPQFIEALDPSFGNSCSLQVLGCTPDWEIYDPTRVADRPNPKTYLKRTSGGHIHLEVGESIAGDMGAYCYMVSALDRVLGTAATFLCQSPEAFNRKKLYGRAGAIRNYKDRIEYRVLPAQALIQSAELAYLMFTAGRNIAAWFKMVMAESPSQASAITTYQSVLGEMELLTHVADAINNHNVDACRRYLVEFASSMPGDMQLGSVVGQLLRLRMPNDFNLHW